MADFRPVNLAEIYGAADEANMRRMQIDNYQRSIQRQQQEEAKQQALRGAYAIGQDGRLDAEKTLSNLYGIDPVAAMEFRGKQDESLMAKQKLAGEQEKQKFERIKNLTSVYKDTSTAIFANPTPENAALQLQRFNKLTGEDVSQELQQIGSMTPEQIRQWAAGHALEADKVLTKFETRDAGGQLITQGIDPLTGKVTITGQTQKTATPESLMTDKRMREEGALNRGVTIRGQNMTDSRARETANKPTTKSPLSATAQKELFEADDVATASENAIGMLKEALTLNDKAYSGYGAKGRAVLRSNLPGATPEADATIDLDNLMTGQALESLKAVFGGMPTEGERKILLDMQASADKTPKQRQAILDRAVAAAEKRRKFNKSKADALRKGTYFTEGVQEEAIPASGVIDFGALK